MYTISAGPKPGQTGLKPGFFGHFPGFFGSIPGRKCYNIVIFLANIFCRFCPPPQKEGPAPSRAGPTLAILAVWWVRLLWLFANPGRWLQRPGPTWVWSPWPNSAAGFCALPPAATGLAAPLLAILVIFWQPIPGGFANPGRWLQRPRPRPGLVTLAKPSHRLLCAFSSRSRPRRPTFGYFSYISAANPRAPRSNRPPSSQWCRCPARCPCGGPASPPGRCAPFSGSPRPQWSAAAR